jgi:hypothetical protein
VTGGRLKGIDIAKLEGKTALVMGGIKGMAVAAAKRFVDEGAHLYITGTEPLGFSACPLAQWTTTKSPIIHVPSPSSASNSS